MPVTSFNHIKPGLLVSIVLKADQRTGKQVQGTVSQLLTRHNHPRGIKVKLTDGRVGRVQQILPQSQSWNTSTMSSNNPWADATSQGNPYHDHSNEQQQQQGYGQTSYATSQQTPQQQSGYNQAQQGNYNVPQGAPESQGLHRSDTDQLLAQESDRAEQVEHMQHYESTVPQSEDDKNQAELQKLFPKIDSSLIAAIYNERKPNVGEARELLEELNTS